MGTFEKFTNKEFKAYPYPRATITKERLIRFNVVAMQQLVGNHKYAVLYYNKEDRLIGIDFTNKHTPEAYTVRKYRNNKLGYISAIAFLRYYQIPHAETLTYELYFDEKKWMVILDLNEHTQSMFE